jgi:hypothetical protein
VRKKRTKKLNKGENFQIRGKMLLEWRVQSYTVEWLSGRWLTITAPVLIPLHERAVLDNRESRLLVTKEDIIVLTPVMVPNSA